MPDNQSIKVLFFGDIVGKPGRRAITRIVPQLKEEYKPDLIIANAENLAHGLGVTQKTLDECSRAGVDLFTSGNHIWEKPEVYKIFENIDAPLIRPANYSDDSPGRGQKTLLVGGKSVLVVNLNGQVFIEDKFSCPFHKIDQILDKYKNDKLASIIVDFHAEATSEKVAFGLYLDGRVSAVLGTHTHVATADGKILPKGTAYITDVGMVGLKESVIGIDKNIVIHNFTNPADQSKAHDIPEKGLCIVNAVLVTFNPENKLATDITRIYKEIDTKN